MLQVTVSMGNSKTTEATVANGSAGAGNGDNNTDNGVADQNIKTFHFVIKSPPKASFIKAMHKITKPFLNEVTWYMVSAIGLLEFNNHLQTIFQELLKQVSLVEAQLPDPLQSPELSLSRQCPVVFHAYSNYYAGDVANVCAGCPWFCYLPFRAAEQGILVMENVKKRGFVMFDKMRILPLDHFLLAMTNLAHFHGKWLAYRWMLESGQLAGDGVWSLDKFKCSLNTQKRVPEFVYKQLLNGTAKTTKKILQLEGREDLIPNVRQFFNVTARAQLNRFMGAVVTPIDTCCHGDFWSNNIMFKYDKDGNVNGTVLVDFQLINYGHPAYDILYLLYISGDSQFRYLKLDETILYINLELMLIFVLGQSTWTSVFTSIGIP